MSGTQKLAAILVIPSTTGEMMRGIRSSVR